MDNVIKDLRVLNAIGLKYGLDFDRKFKYYVGNAYKTKIDLSTDKIFIYKNKNYKLKYFSGCFNPYLIQL